MKIHWWTLVLQFVNFGVLVWLLHHFLYRPVSKMVQRRQEEAGKALEAAEEQRREVQKEEEAVQSARDELEQNRQAQLDEAKRQATTRRDEILDEARRKATQIEDEARSDAQTAREAVLDEVEAHAASMATRLATRMLNEVGEPSTKPFLHSLAERLDELSDEDRQSIRRAAKDGAAVRVITSSALDDDTTQSWREKLRGFAAPDTDVEFVVDEALIAGARIDLPGGARLSYNWQDLLEQTENGLRDDATN